MPNLECDHFEADGTFVRCECVLKTLSLLNRRRLC